MWVPGRRTSLISPLPLSPTHESWETLPLTSHLARLSASTDLLVGESATPARVDGGALRAIYHGHVQVLQVVRGPGGSSVVEVQELALTCVLSWS